MADFVYVLLLEGEGVEDRVFVGSQVGMRGLLLQRRLGLRC